MNRKNDANHVKTLLIDFLMENYDVELIALEVPYLFGYRRADLVSIINGNMIAFEIKSELDSLSKLESQINDYIDVFNKVYVVLAEKFKDCSVIPKLPKKVGIFYIKHNDKIICHRKAREQKILKKEKLVYFFKKDEMNKINNIDANLSLRKTRDIFLKINSTKKIVNYSKSILKNKYLNQFNTFITEKGKYTLEEDLSLITGVGKNNHILHLS